MIAFTVCFVALMGLAGYLFHMDHLKEMQESKEETERMKLLNERLSGRTRRDDRFLLALSGITDAIERSLDPTLNNGNYYCYPEEVTRKAAEARTILSEVK